MDISVVSSLAESLPDRTSWRYSLRMTAEDSRIRYRDDWAKGERAILEQSGLREGDVTDSAAQATGFMRNAG